MNNKLFNMSLIILIGIAILGAVAVVLWQTTFSANGQRELIVDEKRISADEYVSQSVETDEITTNLMTNNFIIIKFNVLLDSKKSKEEFEKRSAQAKSIIISTLADLSPDDLQGEEGINNLETILLDRFNEILQVGSVVSVRTIDRKIQ